MLYYLGMEVLMTSRSVAASEPLRELNTTPLIDVLLVLLVMFVISIPAASHSLNFDLPTEARPTRVVINPVRNSLVLERDGALRWNGRTIDDRELAGLLGEVRRTRPEPQMQFEPDANAGYDRTARVLRIVEASGVTRFGFVGNERYRSFSRN